MRGNYLYYPPLPQHFLYFKPLPHIQGALRPILGGKVIGGWVSGFSPGFRSLSTSVMSSGLSFYMALFALNVVSHPETAPMASINHDFGLHAFSLCLS